MLRRRVTELEVEREILKRATAFWMKESRVGIFAFVAAQKADFPSTPSAASARSGVGLLYVRSSPGGWAGPAAVARQVIAGHIARAHAASRRRVGRRG